MISKLQSLKGNTNLKFYENKSNFHKIMKIL